jgi:hypothetical protein
VGPHRWSATEFPTIHVDAGFALLEEARRVASFAYLQPIVEQAKESFARLSSDSNR